MVYIKPIKCIYPENIQIGQVGMGIIVVDYNHDDLLSAFHLVYSSTHGSVSQNTTLLSKRARSASKTSLWLRKVSLGPERIKDASPLCRQTHTKSMTDT